MKVNFNNQQIFKGISTNPLPRLTQDKTKELGYIKQKCEVNYYAKLHK